MLETKKAFTLIELLTTIAIMGILTGVTVVAAQSFREASRVKTALSLANGMLAPISECIDNGSTPSFTFGTTAVCSDTATTPATWADLTETQWEWMSGSGNATYSPFNGSFSYSITDASDATGCITCSTFACVVDKTADCS